MTTYFRKGAREPHPSPPPRATNGLTPLHEMAIASPFPRRMSRVTSVLPMKFALPTTAIATVLLISTLSLAVATDHVSGTVAVQVPGAPRDVRVVVDPGGVQVFFKPPVSTNGMRINNYRVNVFSSGPSQAPESRHYCFASGCAIQLAAARSFRIAVVARNAVGLGATSPLSESFTTYPMQRRSSPSSSSPSVAYSSNWAGYIVTKGLFSYARARFVVPRITCTDRATTMSQWVGIGGHHNEFLEQDGISATCAGGTPSYFAFYEMYGNSQVDGGSLVRLLQPVRPGDAMLADVRESGDRWSFVVKDMTRRWAFTTSINAWPPAASRSSAEFIVEAPFSCSEGFPCVDNALANFVNATFSSVSFARDGHDFYAIPSNTNTYAMTAVNDGNALAIPLVLNEHGTSFRVVPPPRLLARRQQLPPSSTSDFAPPAWWSSAPILRVDGSRLG